MSLFLRLKQAFTRKTYIAFRKHIPLDYKLGDKHSHKNPHAILPKLKQKLLKSKKGGDWKKIKEIQRQSLTPYGRFTKHGFVFDTKKVPFLDIPSLNNCELKPYVDYMAPLLAQQLKKYSEKINAKKLEDILKIPLKMPQKKQTKQVNKKSFEELRDKKRAKSLTKFHSRIAFLYRRKYSYQVVKLNWRRSLLLEKKKKVMKEVDELQNIDKQLPNLEAMRLRKDSLIERETISAFERFEKKFQKDQENDKKHLEKKRAKAKAKIDEEFVKPQS